MPKRNWSREELILAFNLYCKTPFGRMHTRNPEIISLAKLLGRTPPAVSWKLANFARLDPALKKRKIAGASHGGKGEIDVWNEFNSDWERLGFESEKLMAAMFGTSVEESSQIYDSNLPQEGKERETLVRVRVNQGFFRLTVLAAYNGRCCITGIAIPELLTASHIIPWSIDTSNRVNPHNGLCMNALHDRAFDRGLITVTPEYKVMVSSRLKSSSDKSLKIFLLDYDSHNISLPEKFFPDSQLLKYHNDNIFKA
jgi:putative restriction endonuclease